MQIWVGKIFIDFTTLVRTDAHSYIETWIILKFEITYTYSARDFGQKFYKKSSGLVVIPKIRQKWYFRFDVNYKYIYSDGTHVQEKVLKIYHDQYS